MTLEGSALGVSWGIPGTPSQPEVTYVGLCLAPLPTPPWHISWRVREGAWLCAVFHLPMSSFFHVLSHSQLSSRCAPSMILCLTLGWDGPLVTDIEVPDPMDLGRG